MPTPVQPSTFVLSEWQRRGDFLVRHCDPHEDVIRIWLSDAPYEPTAPYCYTVHHPLKPGWTAAFGWAASEELAQKAAMAAAVGMGWENDQVTLAKFTKHGEATATAPAFPVVAEPPAAASGMFKTVREGLVASLLAEGSVVP